MRHIISPSRRHWPAAAALIAALCLLAACHDSEAERAETMLGQANALFEAKHYQEALAAIDSLRQLYPTAIATRRKALSLYQEISLRQAQDDLAHTDSLMQQVSHDYQYQKAKVDIDRAQLRATPFELRTLNETKARLDSLKVRFDVQCAKIKYIHKKQKEK